MAKFLLINFGVSRTLQETQASVAIVHEDYTREVVSAMLGQMVERTASKFYKGRVLTLEEELRKAQAEVSKAADQVNALQQTVQVLSSETVRDIRKPSLLPLSRSHPVGYGCMH